MERGGAVEPLRALRQTALQQHVPNADDLQPLVPAELLCAGGATRDHDGVAQLGELRIQKRLCLFIDLRAPRPVGDRAAAAEHDPHAAVQPRGEILPCRAHRLRRDGRGLTAGEEHVAAGLIPRLGPGEESFFIGEQHVQQRELVGRQGHLVRGDHVLPRHVADARHVHAVGAYRRALPAERAGVHGLVQLMVAHDDLCVVVDLPCEQAGMLPVMPQIGAGFQTFLAAALEAALGLFDGLLPRVALRSARYALQRPGGREIGVEPALARPLMPAGVAGVELLRQTIRGQRRLFRAESRVHHAAAAAHDQIFRLIKHDIRRAFRFGEKDLCRRLRRAEDLKLSSLLLEEVRRQFTAELETNFLPLQPFQLQVEGRLIQKRRSAAQIRLLVRLSAEHRDRIHLLFQLAGEKEREQARAEDRCLLLFGAAKHAAQFGLLAEAGSGCLHRADGDAVAALTEAAFGLARRLAAMREDQREGSDLFIQLQRFFEVPRSRRFQQGAGVQLQRAGCIAEGGLLIDAAFHHAVDLLFGDLADVIDMGRATLRNSACHGDPSRLETWGCGRMSTSPIYHGFSDLNSLTPQAL